MKKKIVALCLVFVLLGVPFAATGCTQPVYDQYFNDFQSTKGFTSLDARLALPKDVFFDTFFESEGKFSIRKDTGLKDADGKHIYLYGIASETEVIIDPIFYSVVDVMGDYAIVTRPTVDTNGQLRGSIGLIKIFGKNLYSDMTTFAHIVTITDYLPLRFVDGHIALFQGRFNDAAYGGFGFFDIQMNEVFKIKSSLFSNFGINDNYVFCIREDTGADFYYKNKKDADGFLTVYDKFDPFSEEDLYTRTVDLSISYLGNGWYLRTAQVASDIEFAGYNIKLSPDAETEPYLKNVSDRYHMDSKSAYNNQTLLPILTANQYNRNEMRQLSSYYNLIDQFGEDKKPVYQFPIYPVADLVKDGYTLVYTYFYTNYETKAVDVSFAILDGSANVPKILEDILMPLLFVDGVGFEVDSPIFNALYVDAAVRDKKNRVTVLESMVAERSYAITELHHDGYSIVQQINLLTLVESGSYEAFEGTELAVPPGRYQEMTPFFSGVATASSYDKATKKRTYYQLNSGGGENALSNVYRLRNGVYVTSNSDETLFGLTSNDGTQFLSDKKFISVYELFLRNGSFLSSYVVSEKDGGGVLYRLA